MIQGLERVIIKEMLVVCVVLCSVELTTFVGRLFVCFVSVFLLVVLVADTSRKHGS